MGGFVLAGLAFGIARGDTVGQAAPSGPHTVREVFTTRVENKMGSQELLAETWTLVGDDGSAEAFVGRYFAPDGTLSQAQYRDAERELVYWGQGEAPQDKACVSDAPASPKSLQGLLPEQLTGTELTAEGYVLGGSIGHDGFDDFIAPPAHQSLTAHTFDLSHVAEVWTRTDEDGGVTRAASLAVDADGYLVGFWSVTTGSDGEQLAANSRVVSKLETYDASLFDQIKREVDWNAYSKCQGEYQVGY
jgi:hypothetical protein